MDIAWGLTRGKLADALALGFLVALLFGRLGCALVHDHLGVATNSALGIDTADAIADHSWLRRYGGPRVFDVGLLEWLALLPIGGFAVWAARRPWPPGQLTAVLAILYACVRFPLDFLRSPLDEPTVFVLTLGQWCSLAMVIVAAGALGSIRRRALR